MKRIIPAATALALFALSVVQVSAANSMLGTWHSPMRGYDVYLRIVEESDGKVKGSVLSVNTKTKASAGALFLGTGSAKGFKFRFSNGNNYDLHKCAEGICGKLNSYEGWTENLTFRLRHK